MIGHGRTRGRTRNGKDRGAVLVEFALVGPALFLMIIALLDFTLIIAGNTAGTNGAREGARVGITHYLNADIPSSSNHQLIEDEVKERLAGLVSGDNLVVDVRCVDGGSSSLSTIPCTAARVVPGRDLIEVSFKWRHIGASPFVANGLHHETAMLVIQGKPNYSTPLVTSTTSTSTTLVPTTTTTTTTAAAAPAATTSTLPGATTTTTTAPPATTTTTTAPPACEIDSVTFSRSPRTLRINTSGSGAGSIKSNPGPLGVTVVAPGCSYGQVLLQIPGAPAPYGAGEEMTFCASCSGFTYQIGGSGWSTGSFSIKVTAGSDTATYSLSVS